MYLVQSLTVNTLCCTHTLCCTVLHYYFALIKFYTLTVLYVFKALCYYLIWSQNNPNMLPRQAGIISTFYIWRNRNGGRLLHALLKDRGLKVGKTREPGLLILYCIISTTHTSFREALCITFFVHWQVTKY